MKKCLLLVSVIILTACTRGGEIKNNNAFTKYDIIEIEGCDYIQYGSAYDYLHITHKGNCKNKIHND